MPISDDAFITTAEDQMERPRSGDEEDDLRRRSDVEHLVEAGQVRGPRRGLRDRGDRGRAHPPEARMTGIAEPLKDLRIALGEVDVLSILTAATYDEAGRMDRGPGAIDAVATLLGLIRKSATAALAAYRRLHGAVADAQPAPADPSAQDADIVRRIRERCLDNRYEGASDAELLQLFERNKRVLHRSDEDVIAAMTRPR